MCFLPMLLAGLANVQSTMQDTLLASAYCFPALRLNEQCSLLLVRKCTMLELMKQFFMQPMWKLPYKGWFSLVHKHKHKQRTCILLHLHGWTAYAYGYYVPMKTSHDPLTWLPSVVSHQYFFRGVYSYTILHFIQFTSKRGRQVYLCQLANLGNQKQRSEMVTDWTIGQVKFNMNLLHCEVHWKANLDCFHKGCIIIEPKYIQVV